MDARGAIGILLGVVGVALGLLAAAADLPALAIAAGVCALLAGMSAYRAGELPSTEPDTVDVRLEPEEVVPAPVLPAEEPETAELLETEGDDSLLDPITGLYGAEYFKATVGARILAARRHLRPVAVVVLEVVADAGQPTQRSVDPERVAAAIRRTLREADTACHLHDGRFGLILEDTPENGAVWTVERLRRALVADHPDQTLWAGVACYPAHAFDAAEIIRRSESALGLAREWKRDRIEVATPD